VAGWDESEKGGKVMKKSGRGEKEHRACVWRKMKKKKDEWNFFPLEK
jgi:hypothetical protein